MTGFKNNFSFTSHGDVFTQVTPKIRQKIFSERLDYKLLQLFSRNIGLKSLQYHLRNNLVSRIQHMHHVFF